MDHRLAERVALRRLHNHGAIGDDAFEVHLHAVHALGAGGIARHAGPFARAGGRGVAASLWPIDDESAREIASNLYSGGSALPTAASLARAKAALRRRYPRQPYRWAGFVWYGPPTVGD